MTDVTVVRFSFEGDKFEILVRPDPALDYKLGRKKDMSAVMVSDEIYTDSGRGTRASSEKILKALERRITQRWQGAYWRRAISTSPRTRGAR